MKNGLLRITVLSLFIVSFIPSAVTPLSAQLSYTSNKYTSFNEMTDLLREAVLKYPDLTKLYSIGKSYQGRDIWLLEISNRKKGNPDEKPGLYINALIDSSEVVTGETMLYFIKKLLEGYGQDSRITKTIDTCTFYLVPRLMPDQTELYVTTPHNARSLSAHPMDEDGDGLKDEDPDNDVNGDGHIVQMRVKDPNGRWKVSDQDDRLMVRRRPGEIQGAFYRVLTEGLDDDEDGRYNEDRLGGVDPNRNGPGNWRPDYIQRGAGPYPLYCPGVRAEVEFIEKRQNIAGYINHHSSGGVVLRPSTVDADTALPSRDLQKYRVIAAMLLEASGYWLATSVYDWRYPPGTPDTKPSQTWRRPDGSIANDPRGNSGRGSGSSALLNIPEQAKQVVHSGFNGDEHVVPVAENDSPTAYHAWGSTLEYTYELFGIISFASEQWRCAFDNDLNKDGSISDMERLDWNDKHFDGELFIDWAPFQHPQLGEVEIGGWKKYTTSSPPPGKYLEQESERIFEFNMVMADLLPHLKITDAEATPWGGDIYKVEAGVVNTGYIATASETAAKLGRAVAVKITLSGQNVEILDGESEVSLGHLEGSPSAPAEAKWIVRTDSPQSLAVTAYVPTAGRDTKSVKVIK